MTAVNISGGQIDYARKTYPEHVTFVNDDYVNLSEDMKYDKIYSIGMVEHVGINGHREFFSKVGRLLSDEGLALTHFIIRDHHKPMNSWMDDIVFPGSYIPTLSEVAKSIERSGIRIKQVFMIDKRNYYQTLDSWLSNFYDNREKLEGMLLNNNLNASEVGQIMRIWEFYLCGSKLLFNNNIGTCMNIHLLLEKSK